MTNSLLMHISLKTILAYIWQTVRPFSISLCIMVFCAFVWAVDFSLSPYLIKLIINAVSAYPPDEFLNHIWTPLNLFVGILILHTTLWRVFDYWVTIKMIPQIRQHIAYEQFSYLMNHSHTYYQNNFSGSLANKINDLITHVPEMISLIFDRFLSRFLLIVFAVYTLCQVNPQLGIAMGLWVAGFIAFSWFMVKKLNPLAENWSELGSIFTGKVVDALSNILSIRLFARKEYEQASLRQISQANKEAEQKVFWAYFWLWCVYGYSFCMLEGFNLYFLIKGRQAGIITPGDFALVFSISGTLAMFLWEIAKNFSDFTTHVGKVTQALRTITVPIEIKDKKNAVPLKITKGEIIFDQVKFHYQNASLIFADKSVTIKAGQKVGLVGYSGSGKSTFVNLILRLFDIQSGKILIDGQNTQEVTQASLHEAIGMIPQDPTLFHRTLKENIYYGDPSASEKDLLEASKRAYAHEFIIDLPDGYNSLVGERGIKLSGGQRQRIAIARAMLKNAPILILDEATSQLDSVTEQKIQESLWHLMQDKTTIIIAHRLSTLLNMDRILVFDKGKIVEDGTHEELLKKDGLYKILWDTQIGGFLPE